MTQNHNIGFLIVNLYMSAITLKTYLMQILPLAVSIDQISPQPWYE